MSSSLVLYALIYSFNPRQLTGVIRQNPLCGDSIALSVRPVPLLRDEGGFGASTHSKLNFKILIWLNIVKNRNNLSKYLEDIPESVTFVTSFSWY